MDTKASSAKFSVLEKTLEFQFLLLLLCSLIYVNSIIIITSKSNILAITPSILNNNISLGQMVVGFAAFSFFMVVVFRPLRELLVMLIGHYVESLLNYIINEENIHNYKDNFMYSLYEIQKLAIKNNSRYLDKLLEERGALRNKMDKGAMLAFALGMLLLIDFVIALCYGNYSLSFISVVGSLANQLPKIVANIVQLILGIFSFVILIYALHPRSNENYIYVSDKILAAIEGRSTD